MDLELLSNFKEVAILFSPQFNEVVSSIYEQVALTYPNISILLISSSEILCSAKCNKFESYILVGIECPLHTFTNAIQYKVNYNIKETVDSFKGISIVDSIYSYNTTIETNQIKDRYPLKSINREITSEHSQLDSITNTCSLNTCKNQLEPIDDLDLKHGNSDTNILVVTENQLVLDYYSSKYENITPSSKSLNLRSRVEYLMKGNILSLKFNNKRMIGVIFTSRLFEDIADALVRRINGISRAYKIFLKDISYERLISIDNLDCIVLVDCPLFQCNLRLHIPILSPFSVDCAIENKWTDAYDRNTCPDLGHKDLVISSTASEIMVKREYQGVLFTNNENDMTIYEGQKGIASSYENEGI